MVIGEQVRKLRKTLDLTQREFGDRINLKSNSVALIGGGRNTSDDPRKAVIEFVQKCAAELATPPPEPPLPPASDPDIAAKLARLEEQNREIMAQNQALAAEIAAIREEDAEREAAEAVSQNIAPSQSH